MEEPSYGMLAGTVKIIETPPPIPKAPPAALIPPLPDGPIMLDLNAMGSGALSLPPP